MKKILIITMILALTLSYKVKASSWQLQGVTWTNASGNELPQYYGQYLEFDYNSVYNGGTLSQYKLQGNPQIPSGAKGVLFSVTFRGIQHQPYLECYQYNNNGVCDKYTFNGHQNMSFQIMYNGQQNVNNCYWYDNTFTTIIDTSTNIRGMLYCPIGNNATNINRIDYFGSVTRQDDLSASSYPKYSIGFEKTILWDIDGSNQDIINNQNNNTQAILDQNTTYQDTPSEDINGTTIDDYEQAEQNLLNSLDMNMSLLDGITINPNASAFIWNIADRLRTINPGIILLITSILGMGIIKMVLNR